MEIILVVYLLIVLAMVGIILMQRSTQDGFMSSGGGDGMFTARGKSNVLTKATALLATGFLVIALVMAWIASNTGKETGLADELAAEADATALDAENSIVTTQDGVTVEAVPAVAEDAAPAVPE